jgi:hypothetical protein
MSIHGGLYSGGGIKAARGKFEYRVDLFPRNVGLLDDFLDAGSSFEVL